jgi:molecular chaperone GrpE
MIENEEPQKPESEEEEEIETPKGSGSDAKAEDYKEMREQMLRLAADFDNYKKRVKKDIDGAETLGKASLIKDMLPVVDEFELAMLAVNETKDKNVAKGIEMLYSNFVDVLKKEGLEEINTEGIFDPYKHEIVLVRESDKKDGTILEVVKKGYMFETRMLRPASVIISKKKGNDANENEKTNDN